MDNKRPTGLRGSGDSELSNCPECKALFVPRNRPVCDSCWNQQEFEIKLVQQWMKLNQNSTLLQASAATEVPVERISEYIRTRRLLVMEAVKTSLLKCESCGLAIVTGKYCRGCMAKIAAQSAPDGAEGKSASSGGPRSSDPSSQIRKIRRTI